MNRLAIVLRIGVVTAGFVLAAPCLALAGNVKSDSVVRIAPVSSATPDVVAVEPLPHGADDAVAASAKFSTVSPSIIAEIGPAPKPAERPGESEKKKRFDPEPLVIRAGMIGGAAPVEVSATRPTQPKFAADGHLLPPESSDKPAEADHQKPLATPK
jgi:hypothetical protein